MQATTRRLVLAALVAGLASATSAGAAAKPPCNIITDNKGDGMPGPAPVAQSDPRLDIVSADLASNAKTLVGVVRVAGGAASTSVQAGATWSVQFTLGQGMYALMATQDAAGATSYGVYVWNPIGLLTTTPRWIRVASASGSISASEVRVSAPLSAFGSSAGKGAVAKGLGARTERWVIVSADGTGFPLPTVRDAATTDKTYKLGAATCVRV